MALQDQGCSPLGFQNRRPNISLFTLTLSGELTSWSLSLEECRKKLLYSGLAELKPTSQSRSTAPFCGHSLQPRWEQQSFFAHVMPWHTKLTQNGVNQHPPPPPHCLRFFFYYVKLWKGSSLYLTKVKKKYIKILNEQQVTIVHKKTVKGT